MKKSLEEISKKMSFGLRHKPEQLGIKLDKEGWTEVPELLKVLNISQKELEEVVETNDKKRFAFNEEKTKIRASQGHSITVDLKLEKKIPPPVLYHGTKQEYVMSILKKGIEKMKRTHVHLSDNIKTAENVAGRRKGENVILEIDAMAMRAENYDFYLSENKVWLTNFVPSKFISIKKQ